MNEYERYLFDLNGYLVIEEALTPEEVAACNEAIDHEFSRVRERTEEQSLAGGSSALMGTQGRGDLGGMLTWPKPSSQPFRDLLVHPRIVPLLTEILGDGFRLDHLYGILMREGTEGFTLHGGGATDSQTGFFRFHNGKIHCGLTVVSWVLTDAGPGDGGFACVPGSHKSNYPMPRDVALLETDIGVVKQVEAKAGSVIIFTEALTHGTMPWRAKHQRRAILYKFSPGAMSYSRKYLPDGVRDVLEEFTPEQRAVLEPPYQPARPQIPDAR